ncbi:hypothetical protein KP509_34G011100 [Ceratopteris richardii]|uniref:H15 domain-containing protein n=1 Tax=Ceratopteris richardii TaxID=49495 RepID=A0A8T2QIV6_CERRI|nr:hypothetical protein KP509_34G011100 [Ceratopteris richardii]
MAVEGAEKTATENPPSDVKADEKPAKKTKASKEKKPRALRAPSGHPPYLQMIAEAIAALKERSGSSQPAIVKFLDGKYKAVLPPNYKKQLSVQLKKFVVKKKLIQIKHSVKLAEGVKKKPGSGVKKTVLPKKKIVAEVKSPKSKALKVKKPKVTGAAKAKVVKPNVKPSGDKPAAKKPVVTKKPAGPKKLKLTKPKSPTLKKAAAPKKLKTMKPKPPSPKKAKASA